MLRIGVNGFGRIGRAVTRLSLQRDDIKVVAINGRSSADSHAYLLGYDSVHGKLPVEIKASGDKITVGERVITCFKEDKPENIPWQEARVDIVIESTGVFKDRKSASGHLEESVSKVIISAPSLDVDKTVVMGVNEEEYDQEKDKIVSNASCTTNCLAPLCKLLDENFGIKKGMATTIHAITSSQSVLDRSNKKDQRLGRSAINNIIPTTTGAAKAVGQVLPKLVGKIDAMSLRVPVLNGSAVDLKVLLEKNVTREEVLKTLENSEVTQRGILEVSKEALVLQDIIGNTSSCIVDSDFVSVIGDNLVTILAWYDNEIGYSARLLDLAVYLSDANN